MLSLNADEKNSSDVVLNVIFEVYVSPEIRYQIKRKSNVKKSAIIIQINVCIFQHE